MSLSAMFTEVNWLAILACGIAAMVVGFVWYGPLFSKKWSELTGHTREQIAAAPQSAMIASYGSTFVLALVSYWVLANLLNIAGVQDIGTGLILAFFVWLGFIATSFGSNYLFDRKPLMLFVINTGYNLINLLIGGVILTVWQIGRAH